jgi:aryl-alcohol dehydrogenase-like predicted oxidoreductase
MEQLRENLAARETVLTADVLAKIEDIHLAFPNPAP